MTTDKIAEIIQNVVCGDCMAAGAIDDACEAHRDRCLAIYRREAEAIMREVHIAIDASWSKGYTDGVGDTCAVASYYARKCLEKEGGLSLPPRKEIEA